MRISDAKTLICAGIFLMAILAAIGEGHANCKFNTATAALAFGNLNSGSPVDVTVSATLVVSCVGGGPGTMWTYSITDDDGLHETGPNLNRMIHTNGTNFLPYSATITPTTNTIPKGTTDNIAVDATVKGIDYQFAVPGVYSDTITVSVTP